MQPSPAGSTVLAVGDPARPVVGRAVVASVVLGMSFFVFLGVAKEVPVLYAHEPWQDDPYDALVSFAIVGLPLLVALAAVRVPLCRADESLPARRVVDLLRLSRLLVGVVAVTAVAEWASVVLRTHRAEWTGDTAIADFLLTVATVAAGFTAWLVHRAWARAGHREANTSQPDWLDDALTLVARESHRLGSQHARVLRALRWCDGRVLGPARRHPVLAAAACSVVLAVLVEAPQVVLEGYASGLAAYVVVVSACAMFVLCTVAGAYLGLVRRPAGSPGLATRVAVVVCAGAPLTTAFRNQLWWLAGTDAGRQDLPALAVLHVLVTSVILAAVLGAALVARIRRTPK